MLLIRVALVLVATFAFPATALADLRSPMLGDIELLSPKLPETRTYPPAIASDGNTTFVAYAEEQGGVTVHRITATGTEIGAQNFLQSPGTMSTENPRLAISGDNVYVAWIEASYFTSQLHAVVAASHDGGRTFGQAVMAGRLTGSGAWDLKLAADGDNVFVAFVDQKSQLWTAGSRDGGRTYPCMALISPAGDSAEGGGDYSLAVDGDHIYWTWLTDGFDIWVRTSRDGGRSLEPPARVFDSPGRHVFPGVPTIAAGDGIAAIAFSQQFVMPRSDHTGTDWGFEPEVLVTNDGGFNWSQTHIGGEANRCVGNFCAAPYGLIVDDHRIYLAWRAKNTMWLAQSSNGGAGFSGPDAIGPYLYTYNTSHAPYLSARGDTFVATWYTVPEPGSVDEDIVTAFSSDHAQTFNLRTVAGGPTKDYVPVAAAWGPDPQGAAFAWWTADENFYRGDSHVRFAPLSAAQPDVGVIDVRPVQAASDAARLAAGHPTTIRTMLRSKAPQRVTVRVRIDLAYDADGQRVERTVSEDVVVRPGLNPVQLLAEHPLKPGQGRVTAKVTLNPEGSDSDPANNTGEGSRAVVQPRALKILFVPVSASDEDPPSCSDVREVADGAEKYIDAAWPVDPATFDVEVDCAHDYAHPPGLSYFGLLNDGGLLAQLERLKFVSSEPIEKVVGVVPTGWFSRQQMGEHTNDIGIAPVGGPLESMLVERQATGGFVVAHELAHNYGWTENAAAKYHLNDEPAPGYWVTEGRDIPSSTIDFMNFEATGVSPANLTGRWISKKTWDFLTTTLSTGVIEQQGLAATNVLSFTGAVKPDGSVTATDGWELPGEPSAVAEGPYTFEQLGADGSVLQTRTFGAVTDIAGLGTEADVALPVSPFALRVPAVAAARSFRIRRGADVLLTRTRSAAAPVVTVTTPSRVALGDDLKVTWSASDADGGTLTSLVSLSRDGGATWEALDDATTGTALTVKATLNRAGEDVRVRVITSDGWNTTTSESGSFTIGGKLSDGRVVFRDWGSGDTWTMNLDGSERVKLPRRTPRAKWSPDGSQLVFDDGTNLWVSKPDMSDARQVTHLTEVGSSYRMPIWNGDGTKLLATRYVNGFIDHKAAVDLTTGAETVFPLPIGIDMCMASRDGSRIAAAWFDSFAIYRADGTGGVDLPRNISGKSSCLSLSPDGRFGVTSRYECDCSGVVDIVVFDLQTGAKTNLTKGQFGGFNAYPTWSPTGEWIVWNSNKDRTGSTGFGATDIWRMHPDGTGAQKIADGEPDNLNFERPDVQPLRGIPTDPEPTLEEKLPVAAAADATGVEGAEITLDASASKPGEAAIASYAWDFDGDGVFTDAEGVAPKLTFPDEGAYPVRVLVTDAKGRSATGEATVTVSNVAPVITDAKADENGGFGAHVTDVGGDTLTAMLDGAVVPAVATGDGTYVVVGSGLKLVVTDGDGGRDEATATRVLAAVESAPTAADATAAVVAGESVDINLPVTDAEGEPLEYELVTKPEHGTAALRAPSLDPLADDVTYTADETVGTDTFTYRVKDGAGESRVATVTVDVQAKPDVPVVLPIVAPDAPPVAEAPRVARVGAKPVDPKRVEAATAPTAADVFTLPSTKSCVSRRKFTIRVAKGDYKQVVVWVNGRRVKSLKGKRITAGVDLRGLPKGSFKVKIAATLKTGKVVRDTRTYRTCAPKSKKGGRR